VAVLRSPADPGAEQGHSAWGQFVLQGRVRAWDGMFNLSKHYTPEARGIWLYRGYIHHGSRALIGRWRDTFTGTEMYGYEGKCSLVGWPYPPRLAADFVLSGTFAMMRRGE
jgi:hypothetical protein